MCANAVNASEPMGYGVIHFEDTEYGPEHFDHDLEHTFHIDYFRGRMVKLVIKLLPAEDTLWEMKLTRGEPQVDYQSWAKKYPTAKALIESAGGVCL